MAPLALPFATPDVTPPTLAAAIVRGTDGNVTCNRWG